MRLLAGIFVISLLVTYVFGATSLQFDYWVQTTTEGKGPSARNGHSAVVNPVNNTLLIFGGRQGDRDNAPALNTLFKFNIVTDTWVEFAPNGPRPLPRFGHSAVATPYQTMIVFGGQNATHYFNDVFKYDMVTDTWSAVDVGGIPPAPRAFHSSVVSVVENLMVVFGGVGYDGTETVYFDDIALYDLSTDTWLPVAQTENGPTERAQHSAVVTPQNVMLVFGGFNGATTFSDVVRYDIFSKRWLGSVAVGRTDASPPGTRAHTAVVSPQQKMLVYGGIQADGDVSGDLWKFDLGTLKWESVQAGGISGPSRAFHSAAVSPFNTMLVFGGHGTTVDVVADIAKYSIATTVLRSYNDGVVMVVLITIIGTMVIALCIAMDLMNERNEQEKIEYAREAARKAVRQFSPATSLKQRTEHLRQVTVDAGKKMQEGFNVLSDKVVSNF